MPSSETVAIVVAAGRGTRMGDAASCPKQYRLLGGEPVLWRTLSAFLGYPDIAAVLPVLHPDDIALFHRHIPSHAKLLAPVHGGVTRQDSVRHGLEALAKLSPRRVLIHDGVRPFVQAALIERVLRALDAADGALPALPLKDTVKVIGADRRIERTLPRHALAAVQTPQAFRFDAILEAHRRCACAGTSDLTDDASVAEVAGLVVLAVDGDPDNDKITTARDLEGAERRLRDERGPLVVRVGQGFDVHAFTDGDHVTLGGLAIPHGRALLGHSDADVALHALTDAVLGALSERDIGHHFPPSDPSWERAASDGFLRFAAERVEQRGGVIDHLDLTLICEAPKIGPHAEAMRRRIAAIAGIPVGRVSVKATTTERLGFTGRQEGIAALATATIRLPEEG
jgi:2-C-methyl-D-erythritol 4-phosphate cytidylyltransferase/2-C-methyl-D-erythritol 2,4-cyclodiphosphate synthase